MCSEVPSFHKVFCFQVQQKYLELHYVVHETSVLRCHTAKHLQNWKIQLHSYKVYQKNYFCIVTIIFVQKLHQFLQFFWTCILRSHPRNYSWSNSLLLTEIPSEYKKTYFGEAAKECHFTLKQTQLPQTISIKIQLLFFWDEHFVFPLPLCHR